MSGSAHAPAGDRRRGSACSEHLCYSPPWLWIRSFDPESAMSGAHRGSLWRAGRAVMCHSGGPRTDLLAVSGSRGRPPDRACRHSGGRFLPPPAQRAQMSDQARLAARASSRGCPSSPRTRSGPCRPPTFSTRPSIPSRLAVDLDDGLDRTPVPDLQYLAANIRILHLFRLRAHRLFGRRAGDRFAEIDQPVPRSIRTIAS